VHLLASLVSDLWGKRTGEEHSGDEEAPTADGPTRDPQRTITRALYASLVLGVVGGVLLVAIGAALIGVILLAIAILAAVGIYRQRRIASLA
jgi:hypothetical protein